MVDMLPESPLMAVLRGLWAGGAVPLAGAPLFVYNDVRSLIRYFRKYNGISPAEFRQSK